VCSVLILNYADLTGELEIKHKC